MNWSSRSACRACEVAAWPSLGQSGSAHHKKKKGPAASSAGPAGAPQNKVDQTVVKTAARVVATSATAVVTASAAGGTVTDHVDLTVHSAPKGMTASSVAALKAELAGLEAALASLVGSNGSASASLAAQVQASVDALKVQIRDKRPPGERLEGLRGAIQRGEQRLLTAKQELAAAVAKVEAEQELLDNRKAEMAALESELLLELSSRTPFRVTTPQAVPPWLCDALAQLASGVSGGQVDQQTLVSSLLQLAEQRTPASTPECTMEDGGGPSMEDGEPSRQPMPPPQWNVAGAAAGRASVPRGRPRSCSRSPHRVTDSSSEDEGGGEWKEARSTRRATGRESIRHYASTPQLGAEGSKPAATAARR